ncbi:type IV pilus biogenesis protein PilP [Pseudoduganella flava]|uniref:Type IV pilus biogenesis protein PilP n=1 Tax=Pseudoduganella flava TaxID=871742 RepID=A0A562PDG5_9BURK|nr:type IV pilus biogenesis protein PilP [Pseudoduganella flava]QGZ42149.1 type IV pilus biogenesis protein PilP [Pseudoduganella flava]TWI42474.1 type IV pilus biogenesis protein PilP [Pseudoduganella flava]
MQSKHYCAAALAICAALPAAAQNMAQSAAASLTRIEAETLLLKARERQLEVQSSIIAKQNEIAAKQALGVAITQPPPVGQPVVRAIEGLGGRLYATLEMADGSMLDVQAGSELPTGMRIVAVEPNAVVAQMPGKKRVRLAGHTQAAMEFNPNYPSPGLALPMPSARGAVR